MPITPASDVELRDEQRKIYLSSAATFLLCPVVLGGAHLLLGRVIEFPGDELEAKLSFLVGANLFLVMCGIGMVERGRRRYAKDIGGSAYSSPSPKIAIPIAFLQSSLEQFVVASVTLSALVLCWGRLSCLSSLCRCFCLVSATSVSSWDIPKVQAGGHSEWR
ncbi:hypothetical protein [Hyphomicrobium sp. CS1BSMeth3]|uniref:hypothetical protein n=1 Tax=Hyphomicrobium sp. CS1BSMeth3 TaxID=1892844 RepID=UPI000930015C|nr:hypothetical protein [Hyphomicrobium sp. CS1BSMeth3]